MFDSLLAYFYWFRLNLLFKTLPFLHQPCHYQLLIPTFDWFDQYDWSTTKCVSVVQMRRHGFGHFVGIDGSDAMLELARKSGLYQDLKLSMLGDEPLPVQWGNLVVHYFTGVTDHCDSVGGCRIVTNFWLFYYLSCMFICDRLCKLDIKKILMILWLLNVINL